MTPVLLADFVVFPSPRNPDCIAAEEPEDRAVTVVGQSSLTGNFKLAVHFDFVASIVTANVAGKLAKVSKSFAIQEDDLHYQALACRVLNKAICELSSDNSDAVLAASILISLHQSQWQQWQRATEGVATVVSAMRPGIRNSEFSEMIVDDIFISANQKFLEAHACLVGQKLHNHEANHSSLLSMGIDWLNRVYTCVKNQDNLSLVVRQLRDTLKIVRNRDSEWPDKEQFRLARLLRLGWIPGSFTSLHDAESHFLITLADLFAVFLVLTTKFPAINHETFTFGRLKSILQISQVLQETAVIECKTCSALHDSTEMMTFPYQAVTTYWAICCRRQDHAPDILL